MSLDIYVTEIVENIVFDKNITHNLTKMADAAGLYYVLWRPEEINVKTCNDALPILQIGLATLKIKREEMIKLEPSNGWGTYAGLVDAVESYIEACKQNPNGKISVSR